MEHNITADEWKEISDFANQGEDAWCDTLRTINTGMDDFHRSVRHLAAVAVVGILVWVLAIIGAVTVCGWLHGWLQ